MILREYFFAENLLDEIKVNYGMWQFCVDYSVTYFDHIAVFEVPYCWTSVKGGAHMCFVDAWISTESMKHIWAPPLTEVQQYGTSKAAMRSKYATE